MKKLVKNVLHIYGVGLRCRDRVTGACPGPLKASKKASPKVVLLDLLWIFTLDS